MGHGLDGFRETGTLAVLANRPRHVRTWATWCEEGLAIRTSGLEKRE